jgi:hypothetical protein
MMVLSQPTTLQREESDQRSSGEKSASEINPRPDRSLLQGYLRPREPAFFKIKTRLSSWLILSLLIDLGYQHLLLSPPPAERLLFYLLVKFQMALAA